MEAAEVQPANAAAHTYDKGYAKWEKLAAAAADGSDDDGDGAGASSPTGNSRGTAKNPVGCNEIGNMPVTPARRVPKPDPQHQLTDENKATMEDIGGDGSVLKKILTPGDGSGSKPTTGISVRCHYLGRWLDGEKFDSSRDRGEPFSFKIGNGVIQGWSEAVATMEVGEVAHFCMVAAKAGSLFNGADGSPPQIPGGAPVQFEIELLGVSDYDDVAGTEGNVQKKTLQAGTGWKKPKDDDVCMVHARITLEDGTEIREIGGPGTPAEYTPSSSKGGPLDVSLSHALKSLTKGERAEFVLQPAAHGYGTTVHFDDGVVPADAVLRAELQLSEFFEVKDITPDGQQGGIKMKIIKEGNGYKTPKDLSTAKLHCSLALPDGTVLYDTHAKVEEDTS